MFGTMEEFNNYYAIPIQRENDQEAIEELKEKGISIYLKKNKKKRFWKDLPDKIRENYGILR